jgi:hypothetical protein
MQAGIRGTNGYREEVLDEYEFDQAEAANMPAL